MSPSLRAWMCGVAGVVLTVAPGRAQVAGYQLPASLSPDARTVLAHLVDSARTAGLPTEPLVLKAAEGALKGADDARIVRAVRLLVAEYGAVRALLPPGAGPVLMTAAVNAMRSGISQPAIRDVVRASGGNEGALVAGLVAASDLMANGVPATRAAAAVAQVLRGPTPESALLQLRSGVAEDVARGGGAEAALSERLTNVLRGVRPP
jgi:hypothetical protein